MHWVAIAERYKVNHLYVEMLYSNGRQNLDYKALFKEKTGIYFDELYEGYAFKRK